MEIGDRVWACDQFGKLHELTIKDFGEFTYDRETEKTVDETDTDGFFSHPLFLKDCYPTRIEAKFARLEELQRAVKRKRGEVKSLEDEIAGLLDEECYHCKGEGTKLKYGGGVVARNVCPVCKGKGRIITD